MVNFIHSLDKYIYYKAWGEVNNPYTKFKGAIIKLRECMRNFIPHITGHDSLLVGTADWNYMHKYAVETK